VRAIFQRLVTPERTRAVVEAAELCDISPDVPRIVAELVEARLLVAQARGEGAVELVHESLITSWPTLRRWLDENHDDAAYLAQIRGAAKQWDTKGRPAGLLWRGEALDEARLWRGRYQGELPERERAFLDAAIAVAMRATRIRRAVVAVALATLAVFAGFMYRAKQEAQTNLGAALSAKAQAQQAVGEALAAQKRAQAEALAARTAERAAEEALAAKQVAEQGKSQAEAKAQQQTQLADAAAKQAAAKQAAADKARRDLEAKAAAERAREERKRKERTGGVIDKGGL
jgi:hypothetical protein